MVVMVEVRVRVRVRARSIEGCEEGVEGGRGEVVRAQVVRVMAVVE